MDYDKVNEDDEDKTIPIDIPRPIRPPRLNLLNLAIILFIILILVIYLIKNILPKSTIPKTMPLQEHVYVQHNLSNFTVLQCPTTYSFSPLLLECLECSKHCEICKPGMFEKRPCLVCDQNHSLYTTTCVEKDCPRGFNSHQGVCLKTNPLYYEVETILINSLKVETSLSYIVYLGKHQEYKNLIVMVPPLGETHTFYGSKYDLSLIGDAIEAKIITFETPLEQVFQLIKGNNVENFSLISKIMDEIIVKYCDLDQIEQIYFVSMGDGQLLSQHMMHHLQGNNKQIIFEKIKTSTCQINQELELKKQISYDQVELGLLMEYMVGNRGIKHDDNDQQNTEHTEENIKQMISEVQQMKAKYNMMGLFKAAYNQQIDVFILSESGCDIKIVDELKQNKFRQVIRIEVDLKEDNKLEQLLNEPTLDIMIQHYSWLIKEFKVI